MYVCDSLYILNNMYSFKYIYSNYSYITIVFNLSENIF